MTHELLKYFNHDGSLSFIELDALPKIPFDQLPKKYSETFQSVQQWIENYLTVPHSELGRDGPMCPFVRATIVRKNFYISAIFNPTAIAEDLVPQLEQWKKFFLKLEPTKGRNSVYRTILILFPDMAADYADQLFIKIHELLKTEFTDDGLMLGEFHSGPPNKYGLHNKTFKPLYSPIPALVIREMMPTDFGFLKDSPQQYANFLKKFGSESNPKFIHRKL